MAKASNNPNPVDSGSSTPQPAPSGKLPIFKRFKNWVASNKKVQLPLVALGGLVILWAIIWFSPLRYPVLNALTSTKANVTLTDSKSGKPLFGARVVVAGVAGETDKNGQASLTGLRHGQTQLVITKEAYKDYSRDVTLEFRGNNLGSLALEPTGIPLNLHVMNKINHQPAADVKVSFGDSNASSDKEGHATLVIPPTSEQEITIKLSGPGYAETEAKIKVGTDQAAQEVEATPAGQIYFLSKRTGKINVMKSNLDGTKPKVVLEGTGNENDQDTVLLASRDWKYLALKSIRTHSKHATLYLINTANDQLSEIDSGTADFNLIGWYDNHFLYSVYRNAVKDNQSGRQAIKSFNALTGQLLTLDSSQGIGKDEGVARYETIDNYYILTNELVYTKVWSTNYESGLASKSHTINSIQPDGGNHRVIKAFAGRDSYRQDFIEARLYKPQELYFRSNTKQGIAYWEYANRVFGKADSGGDSFYRRYPTYLYSPNSNLTFWSESRDGKNTLLLGDKNAGHAIEVAALSEYKPYGWFSDDYLLISKNDSELYIIGTNGLKGEQKALKITDYHKPDFDYFGYGYGYGGI